MNVIALVGERGREVVDFLEESLGAAGRARSRRRVRDQRRAQPGPPEGGVRRHRDRRILSRPGQARALHARFDHARRARPARGRAGGRRAARAAGLSAQRVRAAAPAARTDRDERARIDHRALHRAGRGRRHGRADRRRGARHPRRSRHPVARHRGPKSVARRRRAAVAVAPHERGRRARAPRRRPAPARAAGGLRAPARSDLAGRLPARRRSAHRSRHRRAWTRSPRSCASAPTRARPSPTPSPACAPSSTDVSSARSRTDERRQLPVLQDPRREDPVDHHVPRRGRVRVQGHRAQGAAARAGGPDPSRRRRWPTRRPRTPRCTAA